MKLEDLTRVKTGPELEQEFRAKYALRKDLLGNPFWEGAYEYAATHKLRPKELRILERILVFKDYTPKPAKGVRGNLHYTPFGRNFFFRIYHEERDEHGHKLYTDYDLSAEDIEIEIVDKDIVLRETPSGNWVDFSDKLLGRE